MNKIPETFNVPFDYEQVMKTLFDHRDYAQQSGFVSNRDMMKFKSESLEEYKFKEVIKPIKCKTLDF